MAVVKNPFMSMDARGSVGGMTATEVNGGNVMKRKAKPSTAVSPTINRARSILGYLSRQWGELTDAMRASWTAWADDHPGTDKFGDPFIMSGFNAFMKLNHTAVRFGDGTDMQDLPPVDPPPTSIDVLTVATGAIAAGDIDVSWTQLGTGIAADFWEIQVAGPFQSKGKKSVGSMFVYKQSVAGNVLLDTIEDLDVGMWYWVRVRYIAADGQVSAWAYGQNTPYAGV